MSGTAKNGKLKPIFGKVNEYAIDPTTGRAGTTAKFKTGKELYNVEIESIPVAKKEALRKLLVNKYKADPKDIEKMFNQFDRIRDKWSELFTGMVEDLRQNL